VKAARILVVEDSHDLCDSFCTLLDDAGYDVLRVKTGDHCLSVVKEQLPDLVLLDVVLPDMSGIEVCKQIKSDELTNGVLVVNVSGIWTSALNEAEALEAGSDGYLTKPIEGRTLLAHIHALLRTKKSAEALRQVSGEFKAAFENAADGMFIVDDTSRCVDVNPSGCALFGLRKPEIVGQRLLDLIEEGLYWEDLEIGWKNFLKQGHQSGEFRLYRPKRTTRDIEYDAKAAVLPNRNLWVLRDVGSRKRTEQAIQEDHEQLEDKVLQRTAELMASNVFLKREIADRKRAEQALLASTTEWEQTFNAIPDQLCIMDMTGAILRANKGMRDCFEPTHGDLVGLDYRICYFGTATPDVQSPCATVLSDASRILVETTFPVLDGSYLVAGYPLFDSKGKQWGAISAVRDITERAQARQALLESEERFRLLIEGVRDYAVFMLDQDGFIVSWNEGAHRIYAYDSDEILGKHFSCFYPPEHPEASRPERALKATILDDRYEDEGWSVRKDGTGFWANTILRALRDDAGNLRGFSKVTRDITEQKRTQAALKETEEKYRGIIENAIEGIFQSTPDGKFISANPAMARMFGYDSAEELIADRRDIESQHYVDPSRRVIFKKLIAEKSIVRSFELRAYRKDGSRIWTSENVRAVTDDTGVLLYYEGIVEDITKRKQVEAERVELLRRLVTAQEDEQRRISRELHDQMGQSLAAVLLGLKSLKDSVQGEPARESVQRLQDITNRIADEMHSLVRELRPTALDDLGLHTALSNYTDEWSQRSNVAIDFHSNGFLNQRLGSQVESTVYRIVQEALNNVMKHANAQNVSIILEKRGNRVLVIVEDDGVGFDAEALLKTPTKNRHFGLLGMQERVTLVGGSFNIESTPGVGSTVLVHIPTSSDDREAESDG
jgi:PAS domain S-box-containing protein